MSYFPSTKTGILKDTSGRKTDIEFEQRAYDEIIANKELLLDADNPRGFIFSHSALKEGWDNPNVFQICFLRHTRSEQERRQQIGRGLRLPVDQSGERVSDPAVNRLTLVIDESFSEFKAGINKEYAEANGSGEIPEFSSSTNQVTIVRRADIFDSDEFKEIWKRIRYKARYRVSIDTESLVLRVSHSERLEDLDYIDFRANIVQRAELVYDDDGLVITDEASVSESLGEQVRLSGQVLPDVVRLIEDRLLQGKFPLVLSRKTVGQIVQAVSENQEHDYAKHVLDDPVQWARIVADAIRYETIEQMVDGIVYEPENESSWWDAEVVFLEVETKTVPEPKVGSGVPEKGIVEAPAGGRNLFTHLEYDSRVEKNFADKLENDNARIRMFTKLPRRFRVNTPVGEYSPDWAIVFSEDGIQSLYLVRETKATLNLDDLDWDEAMRIRFAKEFFEAAPTSDVDYQHVTDTSGLRIGVR